MGNTNLDKKRSSSSKLTVEKQKKSPSNQQKLQDYFNAIDLTASFKLIPNLTASNWYQQK